MIQIVTVTNPFEPRISEKEETVCLGMPISCCFSADILSGRDIYLDGAIVAREEYATTIPLDGSQLIIVPHIGGGGLKKVLRVVATIALTAWAGAIIGGAGIFGYSLAAHSIGAFLAAGAVMYLGGRLINSIFPQQAATLGAGYRDHELTQTYGWDLPTVATNEGGIIGETFGTCIPQPQLLEEHVETAGDGKQYLNLLYCGGYGPVDSITDIRIDSTPIDNFSNVQMETRLGTNDQTPISFFTNTPVDQSVGLMLDKDKALIRTTDSTMAGALEVTLEWNNGLYHLNDNGSYGNASVTVEISYRRTKPKTDWTTAGNYTITNSTSDGFRRSFRIANGLEPSQYDVRVNLVSRDSGSRNMTLTSWSILTAYNNGVYARPNKVLIGMRILATNQLSGGIPNVNWRQTRKTVHVFNPNTRKYEEKDARNPIWAAYDILHGARCLKNMNTGKYEYVVFGCSHKCLDVYYDQWCESAAYADEKVADQYGQEECRFRFDAYFDTTQRRFDAATKAAAVGHSAIIIHGSNYGIVTDKPGKITQVFSEGRTTMSSVQGMFTSRDERAKSVEITYSDANNDFRNTQFIVRSPSYNLDEDGQDNTAQLSLFGVSSRSQAYREGMMALATNERQLQFVELGTDIDGLVAEYGDIVGYSHTVSRIGIASGRLKSATSTTVTLDKAVELSADKTYEIYVTLANDKLIKREVVASDAVTNVLTVTEAFEEGAIPEEFDNYAFGETSKAIKPFRIVGASRDGDLLVKLKLAEYDEAIYTADTNYDYFPDVDYTNYQGLNDKWGTDVKNAIEVNEGTAVHRKETEDGYNIIVERKAYDNVVRTFPTVDDMIKNGLLNIDFGSRLRTLGYYYAQDGGGAEYICRYIYDPQNYPWAFYLGESPEYEYKILTDDKGNPMLDADGNYRYATDSKGKMVVATDADGNPKHRKMYATITSTTVNYRMFGARLDGQTDDYKPIFMAHKYQKTSFTTEPLSGRKYYYVKVANHNGIIRKDNDEPIMCCGDIDLSGSELLVRDCNATWFGFYLWGDNDEDFYTYEPTDATKATYVKDSFVIGTAGYLSQLRQNALLSLKETPYAVRDDAGYLYSEPRYELLLHTSDGVLANPITEDWNAAGGLEIKAPISNYQTHEMSTETANSHFEIQYGVIPTAHYSFKGCDVRIDVSENKYCSVLWCKCHNAHVHGFNFYPDPSRMHNTVFKNTMIYIWGAYNVEVSDVTGFNAAGKKLDGANATSGYVIRATNCLNLHIHDVSVQGYWGATAMNCVKDVHIERVNVNRLDIHNYFYNLFIDQCNLFNHAIQIGEGRGLCQITNCNFYVNRLDADSYPNAHLLEFNTTYGRIFEGKVLIDNCNVYLKEPEDNEFDVCRIEFFPEAVSTLDHYKFPEITIRNCMFHSYTPNTYLVYVFVAGSRNCRTSTKPPTNVRDYCKDTGNEDKGSLNWQYIGRGLDWVDDGNETNQNVFAGEFIRTYDKHTDSDGKTNFYNLNYFLVTGSGKTLEKKPENKPNDLSGREFANGTARMRHVEFSGWQANKDYRVGDFCFTETSMWLPVFCWKCVTAGKSNGYRPVHLDGKVIEGQDVYPMSLDACWWQHVGKKSEFVDKTFTPNIEVKAGEHLFADHRLYKVISGGRLEEIPPQNTEWNGSFQIGTATLGFIGKEWSPKTWWAENSYCVSIGSDGNEHVYRLVDQDGTTSGEVPVRGNARCIDGDMIWENTTSSANKSWAARTQFFNGDVIRSNGNSYKCVFDGRLVMPSQIVLENISTNMTVGGDVFAFYKGTDIPTKLAGGRNKWRIKVDNVDFYHFNDTVYFGHAGNPMPTITEYNGSTFSPSGGGSSSGGSSSSGTSEEDIDMTNVYTKEEIDALLRNKADINHTHDGRYVTPSELSTQLSGKLDVTDSRVHSALTLGSYDVDESTIGGGKVLFFDAVDRKLRYKSIDGSESSETTEDKRKKNPSTKIYTRSLFVSGNGTNCSFEDMTYGSNCQFTPPEGATKFRISADVATDAVKVSGNSYIEFVTKDGKTKQKIMFDEKVANGAVVECKANELYVFGIHIEADGATTIELDIECGGYVENEAVTSTGIPYYNQETKEEAKEDTKEDTKKSESSNIYSKKVTTVKGTGGTICFENWDASKDYQFVIPKGVTRFKVGMVSTATVSPSSYLSFIDADWNKQIKATSGAVVACTGGKTYAFCPWIATNAAASVEITIECGGDVEKSNITMSDVPYYA